MSLIDEKATLIDQFKLFVDKEISPKAEAIDTTGILDAETIAAIGRSGYLGLTISKRYNGLEFDALECGLLNREVGRACSAIRSLLTVHGMVTLAIEKWGTQQQKEDYLPSMAAGETVGAFALSEPNVGSDATSIECSAVIDGDWICINGVKRWITMAQVAGVFLVMAKLDGKPTAFLVDGKTEGLRVIPIEGMLGVRGSMMGEVVLENCKIPLGNQLGKTGMGISHIAMNSLDYGRYSIAWGNVGMCKTCINNAISFARKRKQGDYVIRKYELIQKMVTEMVVSTTAAELMCIDAGVLKNAGNPDGIVQTWNAKYLATKTAKIVTDHTIQIMGAAGCMRGPTERFYRDAKISDIIEGTTQIHELLIANDAYRKVY